MVRHYFVKNLRNSCRVWWIHVQALAAMNDWEELERFARSRKSPIGYEVRQWTLNKINIDMWMESHLWRNVKNMETCWKQSATFWNVIQVLVQDCTSKLEPFVKRWKLHSLPKILPPCKKFVALLPTRPLEKKWPRCWYSWGWRNRYILVSIKYLCSS